MVVMKNALSLVFVAIVITACRASPLGSKGPPTLSDQPSCRDACAHLADLGCKEAKPVDMGHTCTSAHDCVDVGGSADMLQSCTAGRCTTSCVNFCIATEDTGVALQPACVAKIMKCSDIETCTAKK